MQKYKIKYDYRTGDSFGSEDVSKELEFEWTNPDIAKENLQRIREHWTFYEDIEDATRWDTRKNKDNIIPPSWWKVGDSIYKHFDHYRLNLKMDNGKEVIFHAPWCGYFESLYGAEIITDDSDMKFRV